MICGFEALFTCFWDYPSYNASFHPRIFELMSSFIKTQPSRIEFTLFMAFSVDTNLCLWKTLQTRIICRFGIQDGGFRIGKQSNILHYAFAKRRFIRKWKSWNFHRQFVFIVLCFLKRYGVLALSKRLYFISILIKSKIRWGLELLKDFLNYGYKWNSPNVTSCSPRPA